MGDADADAVSGDVACSECRVRELGENGALCVWCAEAEREKGTRWLPVVAVSRSASQWQHAHASQHMRHTPSQSNAPTCRQTHRRNVSRRTARPTWDGVVAHCKSRFVALSCACTTMPFVASASCHHVLIHISACARCAYVCAMHASARVPWAIRSASPQWCSGSAVVSIDRIPNRIDHVESIHSGLIHSRTQHCILHPHSSWQTLSGQTHKRTVGAHTLTDGTGTVGRVAASVGRSHRQHAHARTFDVVAGASKAAPRDYRQWTTGFECDADCGGGGAASTSDAPLAVRLTPPCLAVCTYARVASSACCALRCDRVRQVLRERRGRAMRPVVAVGAEGCVHQRCDERRVPVLERDHGRLDGHQGRAGTPRAA